MPYDKICIGCDSIFSTPDKRRKYCCRNCSRKYNRDSLKKNTVYKKCLNCNNDFVLKYKKAIFCSKKCSAIYHGIHNKRIVSLEQKEKARKSLKEHYEKHPETRTKISNSLIEYNKKIGRCGIKICKECKKEFKPDKRSRVYCSPECYGKNRKAITKNEIAYRTFYKILKRAFPDWKCPFCDWNKSFAVHHIDGRKNNNFDSLIMLCPNHHSLAHMGELSKEDMKKHSIGNNYTKEDLLNNFYGGTNKTVNFYRYKQGKEKIDQRRKDKIRVILEKQSVT